MSPSGLDRIARELAAGEISRRSALKRLAGAGLGLGAATVPAGVAEAMGGGCPPGRKKCGNKCCPKNAKCVDGRCKCKPGYTKCGKKCVDLDTSVKHCGECGNACAAGEACEAGECTSATACTGSGGGCGPTEYCSAGQVGCSVEGQCALRPTACPDTYDPVCGCDGQTHGNACGAAAAGVSVAAVGECACVPSCAPGACGMDDGCGNTCACDAGEVCNGSTQTCEPGGTGCSGEGQPCSVGLGACFRTGVIVCDLDGNAFCSAVAGQPTAELCNGIDDDCDGLVDNGFDVGALCECSPGVTGEKVCSPSGTTTVCACA